MNLIQRVQDILLKPKETWPVIESEPVTVPSLYQHYVMILAAIGPVASFIGMSVVGVGGLGFSVRVPFGSGLVHMVVGYLLALVMVYLVALVVDALAPHFGGTKNPMGALKLVAFSMTASFVGGIFGLLPAASILVLLAGLYSIYLLYLGLPVMMKCPPDKAIGYTAVVVVVGLVAGVLIGTVTRGLAGGAMLAGGVVGGMAGGVPGMGAGDVTIKTPRGEVTIDGGRIEAMGKRMEEAAGKGDMAEAGKAMGDILGAVTGGGGAPIPAPELKALLPKAIGDLVRESIEAQGGQAMGIGASTAKASYVAGARRIDLSIVDAGGLGGLAAMAGWANVTVDRDTTMETERVFKRDGRTVREKARKDGSQAELTVITANGLIVEASGQQVNLATLQGVVDGVGLDKLEAIKRLAKK